MNVLVACEFSGVVRRAFQERGHNAWSCDILPAEDKSKNHYQCDVVEILKGNLMGWDLVIAHPPCTHLSVSGARWWPKKQIEQHQAVEFFYRFVYLEIPMVAIENPIGLMSRIYRKPDQIIQPWQFGHAESKATCLWLKGLPILKPTQILSKPECGYWSNQTPSGQNRLSPGPERAKIRSRTYQGIANAMATQWTGATILEPSKTPPGSTETSASGKDALRVTSDHEAVIEALRHQGYRME